MKTPHTLQVIDSHTEYEPTRVVIAGWPQPEGTTMAERRADLAAHHDHLRTGVICEPRGHNALVGALLTPPVEPNSTAGVIFFNNIGYLGMCGHGTIGVVETLAFLGHLEPGPLYLDTPAGQVEAILGEDHQITIRNVPAYTHHLDLTIDIPGLGPVTGDIAYGGNWFFITSLPTPPLTPPHLDELLTKTRLILRALHDQGITGAGGAEIDHIELTTPPLTPGTDARNFVLCPGGEYDRSPCGTGTSAKLATLYERGELELETEWVQESITGGRFTGWLTRDQSNLIPWIRGRASITAEATLYLEPIRPASTKETYLPSPTTT